MQAYAATLAPGAPHADAADRRAVHPHRPPHRLVARRDLRARRRVLRRTARTGSAGRISTVGRLERLRPRLGVRRSAPSLLGLAVLPRHARAREAAAPPSPPEPHDDAARHTPPAPAGRIRTTARTDTREQKGTDMNHSRRRVATIGGLALAAALVLAACSAGGGDAGRPTAPTTATLTPVKLQLQWLPQAPVRRLLRRASTRATSRTRASTSRSSRRAATSCRRTRSPPATSTTRSPGCPRCSARSSRAPNLTDIAQIFQRSRAPCRSRGRTRASTGRRLRGQEDRLLGLRQRVGDLRRPWPTRASTSTTVADHHAGLQHERASCRVTSTRPRR